MRPTKGEIRNTPASAQATACANENSRVRLHWIPSRSSRSAARMPSHVLAILISRRSRPMPASAYSCTSRRALAMVASVSKLSRASTSVETRPGTSFRISPPIATARRSPASASLSSPPAAATAASRCAAYAGKAAALSSSDGLVVASIGRKRAIASMSPVSATTTDCWRSCSSWLATCGMSCEGTAIVADARAQYRSTGSTSSDQRTLRASGEACRPGTRASSAACSCRRAAAETTSCWRW